MIKIIFEDRDFLIINKSSGILVHPTEANEENTIVSKLIKKNPNILKFDWPDPKRPGIVHRLDKDTSGLLILAKNPKMLAKLQDLFQNHKVKKNYLALVLGKISKSGIIEAAISRHPKKDKQTIQEVSYSFSKGKSRPAITKYNIIKHYHYQNYDLTLIEAMPQTGRMHQIRVHFNYIGHPILGDQLYNNKLSRKLSQKLNIKRQFLHAHELEFIHPSTQKNIKFQSNLPLDLENILSELNLIK